MGVRPARIGETEAQPDARGDAWTRGATPLDVRGDAPVPRPLSQAVNRLDS